MKPFIKLVEKRLKAAKKDLRQYLKTRFDAGDPSDIHSLGIRQGYVMALNDLLYHIRRTEEGL